MKVRVASFVFTWLLAAAAAHAAPLSFSYGGRLTDSDSAVKGPVDLELRFYRVASGGSPIADGSGPIVAAFSGVALEDGVFQVEVAAPGVLSAAQLHRIFDGDEAVYVEVTDKTSGATYARQRLVSMPYALKVPVDGNRARFGADGKLTVGPSGNAGANEFLTTDASGNFVWQAPSGGGGSGSVTSIVAGTGLTGGTITASGTIALASPMPALDGGALTNVNAAKLQGRTVSASAPSTGQVLKWDGTSWTPAADSSGSTVAADAITAAEIATDAVTAAEIAAGAVGAAEIADGSIADADISSSAAIADTKLATIATAGKVSGAAITSGTIGGTAAFGGSGGVSTAGAITGTGNFVVNGTGAATTELRFADNDNSNYVGLKAPGTLASNNVWTLPAVDGGAGQFLSTNGAGVLSWGSPAGGGDVMASANLSDLANVATARSNLGLGSLATLSAVGSSEITDGAIANADISGTAAIATSKLSGAVTSISGHGLGSLATQSAVGSTEITNGSIVDADIAGTAAVATSKLSGPVTSIVGHGLGSLAALSTVGTAEISNETITDADISPTAAIASSKISFANDGISGDKVDGGTISNFASTGIDDNAASTAMTIASTGNIGVGTMAPGYKLHVVDAAPVVRLESTSASGTPYYYLANASAAWKLLLDGADTNKFKLGQNGTTHMTIDSAGNVGIGMTTPTERLHVSGNIKADAVVSSKFFSGGVAHVSNSTATHNVGEEALVVVSTSVPTAVNLPPAASFPGRILTIKTTGAYTVTINFSNGSESETGSAVSLASAGGARTFMSDGTKWLVIAAYQ